ncbi:MAG TPA: palindromic element RPE4 domain-containing protein [Rickettsia endosymbiont of Pyrocoelia pectoralis]|nr:palindromic element RPE4 domain-containing protein [Rickettsia endosymbiont of Pyrocoelia pectoralis]
MAKPLRCCGNPVKCVAFLLFFLDTVDKPRYDTGRVS